MESTLTIAAILLAVTFHELGHFIALRIYGLTPPEFSVGVGPKLWGFSYKGTNFVLRGIPIGGYVKMPEMESVNLTKRQKINVFLAGPWANVFTAIPFGLILVSQLEFKVDLNWFVLGCLVVIGTPILFFLLIPASLYVLLVELINPTNLIKNTQGIVGMVAEGQGIEGLSPLLNFMFSMYTISISLASFNLLPLSILDGGQIFKELFAQHKRFVLAWSVGTTVLLLALFLLINIGDILQLIGFF